MLFVQRNTSITTSQKIESKYSIHAVDWRDFLSRLLALHQTWLRFGRRRAFIGSRLLTSFRHGALLFNLIVRKKINEMVTRIHREIQNVQQTQKMIPFITYEISQYQYVCELVLIWILEVQIDSVEEPIMSNSVDSGHVSHCWTSAVNDHFDHSLVVFKNVELRCTLRRTFVCGHVI